MSHYRWPVVLVALASCGWLPAAAQTTYDTQPGQVSLGFEEPDIPPLETATRSDDRWQASSPDTGTEGGLIRGLQSIEADRDGFGSPGGVRRGEAAPRVAQLQGRIDVGHDRPADRTAAVPPLINAPDGSPAAGLRFSPRRGDYYGQQADAESARKRERKFSTGPTTSKPILGAAPEMPRRIDTDNNPSDGFGESSGQTRNISLAAETEQAPSAASTPTANDPATEGGADGVGQDTAATTSSVYWLPLMMGLFASVAANLFFGWVAWDAHGKYQDLVDDMAESDARLTSPVRARDGHSASVKRQRRHVDEAGFVNVGVDGPTG